MKKTLFILTCLMHVCFFVLAQPDKKPAPKPTNQPDMNKMLEEAMKAEGMSKEEQEEMKEMMKDMMPAMNEVNAKTADYPEFTSNRELIHKKDAVRIAAFSKKALTKTDVAGYANGLYTKMMAKADPAEMAIVKKVVAMKTNATDIGKAAILSMLQGHPQAALALSIKAVVIDPSDLNWQNNMGALLTSYGYPEQAMPMLKKLKIDMPWNSTVLNNIGQAWLSAGETDSANRYFQAAVRFNPQHHEAHTGKGLVEEAKGNPEKAAKTYEEAMHNSVNPFIDQVRKNNKSGKGDLDFEKIKRNLAIYEYFPKDWMPEVPVLHNNVKYYNEDYGMIKGYKEMISELGQRINDMTKTLGGELDDLANGDEKKFVNEMFKSSMQGLSWMSKPAVAVMGVLSAYTTKWHLDYADTLKKIGEWTYQLDTKRQKEIDAIYKQISDQRGTTCQQFKGQLDKLENDFMQEVNTRLRELLMRKTEEYRQWLNAWCTWSWYVTGNTKNIILMQDINFTQYLAEMYIHIVTSMVVKPEHCNPPVKDETQKIYPPEIPNFACPAVVSIPAGEEWEDLVAAAKDFDANEYLIKKTDKPVPNVSVAYGSKGMVAEPGKSSFIKTANGSITPGLVDNSADPGNSGSLSSQYKQFIQEYGDEAVKGLEWTTKELEASQDEGAAWARKELTRLINDFKNDKLSPEEIKKMDKLGELLWDHNQQVLRRNSTQVNKLLEQMMSADCNGKQKSKDKLKDHIRTNEDENRQSVKELLEDPDHKEVETDPNQPEIDRLTKEFNEIVKDYVNGVGMTRKRFNRMERIAEVLNDYREIKQIGSGGIQPTISSGPQAPGTFTPNKTLFQ